MGGAGFFTLGELSGAEDGEVGGIALIDIDEGWIRCAHDVIPCFHFLGVGGLVGDDGTSGKDANVELGGGRLVVGISKTVAYAGAVDDVMDELNTRIGGRRERWND